MTYRVLVTGGRDYEDRGRVFKDLSRIREKHPDMEVWSGMDAGTDQLVYDFCTFFGADYRGFSGLVIDPSRRIIDLKPDLVVAFPGGKGTADCVERAKKAGLKLWDRRNVDGH